LAAAGGDSAPGFAGAPPSPVVVVVVSVVAPEGVSTRYALTARFGSLPTAETYNTGG
jgi:hypothetical protein